MLEIKKIDAVAEMRKKIIQQLAFELDQEMKAAILHITHKIPFEDISKEECMQRGQLFKFLNPNGQHDHEDFIFDGIPVLRIWPPEIRQCSIIETQQPAISVYRKIERLYLERTVQA